MEKKELRNNTFILRQNSEKIRRQIMDAGIYVCPCTTFEDVIWLDYSTRVANGVHGVGYHEEELGLPHTQEEAIAQFINECENPIICNSVEDFIKFIKYFEEECK